MTEKSNASSEKQTVQNEFGSVQISEEVVSSIAAKAASEVEGLAAMSGGITQGIVERLGKRDHSKGLKVKLENKDASVDLYIVVNYGIPVQEITLNVQKKVKENVEKMTGLKVIAVNVNVQGINIQEQNTSENQ